jgi:beta-mannosidase
VKQRIRAISGLEELLVTGWEMCAGPSPDGPWIPAGPTVAAGLRAAGAWSLDAPVRRFDAEEWWFRARLPAGDAPELALCCDGLATLAEVFLDGRSLFLSQNMFTAHEHVIPAGGGELTIHFRSLDAELAKKRPRPRWRAPMIENQQLRWIRATLLGRTPGWSPPAAAVGPWRPVRIERRSGVAINHLWWQARPRGEGGVVEFIVNARSLGAPIEPAELIIERNGETHRAPLENGKGCVNLPQVTRWWPHTHGEPALYRACLRLGDHEVDLGHIGFREVTRDGDFSIAVNGVPIFCRGACWTPLDPVTLSSDRAALSAALTQARDAGMNMLRVGGTMAYESDDFYDLCDELGILVWQDFMFANMDYPEDEDFARSVQVEAGQILSRLQARPSLAVLCGNSEGEQQAAMFGAPRERWSPKLFHETLPALSRAMIPDVPYWPSSAHGGQ